MVYLNGDYIITPLGEGVAANLAAIRQGETRIAQHNAVHGEPLVAPVMASLLDERSYEREGYSLFESLCIRAVEGARVPAIDIASARCLFILSSTKGDIWCSMAETAQHIAEAFDNHTAPVVVSTACTSGVSAQVVAWRLLESGQYDTAVVVGCDIQREFIVSGFQCFHALSDQLCKPFDAQRNGLNAGEAVACMLLSREPVGSGWQLLGGSIHNDANHISGPSRTAEGSLRCVEDALQRLGETPALVSVHGTGTLYNDEMESIALHRAGLEDVPVTALKGYYGHTMGAAGLLETILSLHALSEAEILPTKGYTEQGTTYPVNLSGQVRTAGGKTMIKLLSGFGGVNAAAAWRQADSTEAAAPEAASVAYKQLGEIRIENGEDLVGMYRAEVGDYPKFFKMDLLSRLGFMAVEQLLREVRKTYPDYTPDGEHCALIIANRSASLKNDTDYQATITDKNNYYPSPALFVYTLPNIVTGEIAIRHKLYGETACYILNKENELAPLIEASMRQKDTHEAIVGWVECENENNYTAHLRLITKQE